MLANVKPLCFSYNFTFLKFELSCVNLQVAGSYAIKKKQFTKLIIESITLTFDHWPCIISIATQLNTTILKLKNVVFEVGYNQKKIFFVFVKILQL